jgi:hypothetical protein
MSVSVGRSEFFGTDFKPNLRWRCPCGGSNVSRLLPPIRPVERVSCRQCHRVTIMNINLKVLPQVWGGFAIGNSDVAKT